MPNRDKELRRIWNKADIEFRQKYKGEEVIIPAHGSIVRGRRWAVDFMGVPTDFNRERPDDPRNIKQLYIEPTESNDIEERQEYNCNVCGEHFANKQSLGGHTKAKHGKAAPAPKPA